MVTKTYECTANCGLKFVATEARAQKWLCRCGGKIVASWWGKLDEGESSGKKHEEEVQQEKKKIEAGGSQL